MNRLDYLESLIQIIQKRGGKVIFLVIPSSGLVREIEKKTLSPKPVLGPLRGTDFGKNSAFRRFPCIEPFHLPRRRPLGLS